MATFAEDVVLAREEFVPAAKSTPKNTEEEKSTKEENATKKHKSKKSTKTEVIKTPEPVIKTPKELEVEWASLGLGRGIDITKKTPWMDKVPFQVRAVRYDDLIITDEGKLLKGYSDVVNNSTTIHSQVRAGVKAPFEPLDIGVDAEYTRTDCSSKHVVGLKIKNKTISFKLDFQDLPKSWVENVADAKSKMKEMDEKMRKLHSPNSSVKGDNTSEDDTTSGMGNEKMRKLHRGDTTSGMDTSDLKRFQERLCDWLVECLKHRGIPVDQKNVNLYDLLFLKVKEGSAPAVSLIDSSTHSDALEKDVYRFVRHLGITHYVSAIELGGMHFSILTEKEYEQKVSASGNASLNSKMYGALEVSAKASHFKKSNSRHTERKMIGKITITEGKEVVHETDQAVIGCKIRPISSLVSNPYIQQALNKAVKQYTDTEINVGGPYIVSCGDNPQFYLRVDSEHKNIALTLDKKKAEAFTVKAVSETRNHHELEFSLTSSLEEFKKHESKKTRDAEVGEGKKCMPLEYVMEMVVNPMTGRGKSAPRMRLSSNYRRTRLLLKKRSDHRISCNTQDWIKGADAYYIQCIHPLFTGFLCVKQRKGVREGTVTADVTEGNIMEQYKVCVDRAQLAQQNETQYLMLFRLQAKEGETGKKDGYAVGDADLSGEVEPQQQPQEQ